jgi:heme exporter protein C
MNADRVKGEADPAPTLGERVYTGFTSFTWLWMTVSLIFALGLAPTEAVMGPVQRLFYWHVASSWCGYLALAVAFVASLLYLWRRGPLWDALAVSSSEVGWVFITLGIGTGMLWAKPVWGTWWTWDPRLTTSAVVWLIYGSYLLLRGAVPEPTTRARLAAVTNVAGFWAVPLNYMAIRWWRAAHPLVLDGSGTGLAPDMTVALLVSVGAFTCLYVTLLILRFRLERVTTAVRIPGLR